MHDVCIGRSRSCELEQGANDIFRASEGDRRSSVVLLLPRHRVWDACMETPMKAANDAEMPALACIMMKLLFQVE